MLCQRCLQKKVKFNNQAQTSFLCPISHFHPHGFLPVSTATRKSTFAWLISYIFFFYTYTRTERELGSHLAQSHASPTSYNLNKLYKTQLNRSSHTDVCVPVQSWGFSMWKRWIGAPARSWLTLVCIIILQINKKTNKKKRGRTRPDALTWNSSGCTYSIFTYR